MPSVKLLKQFFDALTGHAFSRSGYLRQPDETVHLRLRTLVLLRWLAIGGQSIAVVLVAYVLHFPLPVFPCFLVIFASVWLNIGVALRYPSTKRLTEREALRYLAFDIIQLASLLWMTGGLKNPFAILFLAPVTIAATSLSARRVMILLVLSFSCATVLSVSSLPLPWHPGVEFDPPRLFQWGLWIAMMLGISFTATYSWRISREARNMSEALSATQIILAREQRMSALGGLAAAAAHELGTPLATINLVAKEMRDEVDQDSEMAEDASLLVSEVERCREILGRLSANPHETEDGLHNQMEIGTLVHELLGEYDSQNKDAVIDLVPLSSETPEDESREPIIERKPEILYGIGNFISNALDFAANTVRITVDWDDLTVSVRVEDDGPGYSPSVIDFLGEPYLTTRPRKKEHRAAERHEGMGLGVFIAKTLINRTGGVVNFSNKVAPRSGAVVEITWPRAQLDLTVNETE